MNQRLIVLTTILIGGLAANLTNAAIKIDSTSSHSSSNNGYTLTWTHTLNWGKNQILVVGLTGEDENVSDLTITSVTYNGINMSPVIDSAVTITTTTTLKAQLYYLLERNMPSPGTYEIVATYSGNVQNINGGAISLSNVKQEPAEAVETNSHPTGGRGIFTSITIETDGAWLVDVVGCSNPGSFIAQSGSMDEYFDTTGDSSSAAGATRFAESAEKNLKGMDWQVYVDPKNPGYSGLESHFPLREIFYGICLLGVFLYFVYLRVHLELLSKEM